MVKRTLLAQKLTSYSVLATAVLAGGKTANGQIVYTKVNDTICPNSSYNLDLNGDGKVDFVIRATSQGARVGCLSSTYFERRSAMLFPYNSESQAFVAVHKKRNNSFSTDEPVVINSAQSIGQNDTFSNKVSGRLVYNHEYIGGLKSRGYFNSGLWDTLDINKFVGLSLKINSNIYYGWARLSILSYPSNNNPYGFSDNGYCVVLTDYAIMGSPNIPIKAGEESNGISAEIESNNLAIFPDPVNRETPLTISCILNYAQQPVTINLYDIMGREVNNIAITNSVAGLNTFQLPVANLPPGIYQVKISCNEFMTTKEIVIGK